MRKLIALMVVILVCSVSWAEPTTESQMPAGRNTLTVTHALGTVEVPESPSAAAVFTYDVLDILDELGLPVAAVPKSNVPGYLSHYADNEAVIDAGTLFEPDYEALFAAEVDVIFISDRQVGVYDQLSEIAPVVYTTIDPASYFGSIETNWSLIGRIYGAEDEMESYLDEVSEAGDMIRTQTGTDRALFALVSDNAISVYGLGSRFGFIHDDFGFTPADENIEVSRHGQTITFEYLAEVDPDVLFVLDRGAAITGVISADSVLDNDIVRGTSASQNDRIVYVDSQAWYLAPGGVAATQAIVDDVLSSIE